jgi:hypothetical protein
MCPPSQTSKDDVYPVRGIHMELFHQAMPSPSREEPTVSKPPTVAASFGF